jgi:hypothetical protein
MQLLARELQVPKECTFKISGAAIFGPREENKAISGASPSFMASLFRMVA